MTSRGIARWTATVLLLAVVVAPAFGTKAAAALPRAQEQTPAIKVFEVTAKRWEFSPDRIEVDQGDRVRITVVSADGMHGFAIRPLNINADVPRGGTPATVDFVATRPGSFHITCSTYCGRGHKEMHALLVVRPREAPADRR